MPAYRFKPGQWIKFTYRDIGADTQSRFKEVVVLHPNWQGLVHALDLGRMTPAQREVVAAIFDPKTKEIKHRIPLVNDIVARMDPIEEIKNPVSFYSKFVKVFLRTAGDVYRTYYPQKMSAVVTVKQTTVRGKVINPKPLFKKADITPQNLLAPTPAKAKATGQPAKKAASARPAGAPKAAKPAKAAEPAKPAAPTRMDLIKQRMAAMKKKDQ